MSKDYIKDRLAKLRESMKREGIDAYIIPSSDHHLSEYPPDCWKDREWISSFDGSAGTAMVTLDAAGLWTDSRYFLQATEQLEGTSIELFKMGVPGVPTIAEYLRDHKDKIKRVGFYGKSISAAEALSYGDFLKPHGIQIVWDKDLIAPLHEEPLAIPKLAFYEQPLEYAGYSVAKKLELLREKLHKNGANTVVITMLDELAWLYNIRGTDVVFNPVGIAYGMVTEEQAFLYVEPVKLPDELREKLQKDGVCIKGYNEVYQDLQKLTAKNILLIDKARINYALYQSIPEECPKVFGTSALTLLKAIKNDTEIAGFRTAMRRDAVALTRFFMWLEQTLEAGETPSEYFIGEKLNWFRAQGDLFVSDSFGPIAGYRGNGAIVHYSAKEENCAQLKPSGMFLLDSGGQYRDGTTDITRTISLDGKPTPKQKADYTRVMKGHIAIAKAIFPQGTRGSQLDILARKALWDNCQNYGHGTGHGVGHFLNVHEGPQNIRLEENPALIEVGTVTSNEPGLYIAGEYGIRIENLILCVPYKQSDFGNFYAFETLTLCYFDNRLIDESLLTDSELEWYNSYQKWVYDEISPLLEAHEAEWLKEKTKAIER